MRVDQELMSRAVSEEPGKYGTIASRLQTEPGWEKVDSNAGRKSLYNLMDINCLNGKMRGAGLEERKRKREYHLEASAF